MLLRGYSGEVHSAAAIGHKVRGRRRFCDRRQHARLGYHQAGRREKPAARPPGPPSASTSHFRFRS
eukprot:2629186-Pyramimonas_sp.AAC.1